MRPEAFAFFDRHLAAQGFYRDPSQRGDVRNEYGNALFVRPEHAVVASGLVTDLPFPERGVWADVLLNGEVPAHVVSFHSLNGVGHGELKMDGYAAVHAHLQNRTGARVLAFDANWSWDCWPEADEAAWAAATRTSGDNVWRWHHMLLGPDEFKGPDERTGLRDGWRDVLAAEPARADRIRSLRPDGPSAVTFMNKVRGPVRAYRYDLVYISDEIAVGAMRHHYADAVGAHSDHALVEATLRFSAA